MLALIVLVACTAATGETAEDPRTEAAPPAACQLSPHAYRDRLAEIEQVLAGSIETRELDDGYELRFPGDGIWAARLLGLIQAERQCCPFLTFELAFGPGRGPVWFRLRGSREAKAVLAAMMADRNDPGAQAERDIRYTCGMIKVADNGAPRPSARFDEGTLVRHRRYGYRGVIVALDPTCQAPDEWYYSNQTQPSRDQPWYHVLVHQSAHVTYAAQENVEIDTSGEPVHHPLVDEFFEGFQGDHYQRNSKPWPG